MTSASRCAKTWAHASWRCAGGPAWPSSAWGMLALGCTLGMTAVSTQAVTTNLPVRPRLTYASRFLPTSTHTNLEDRLLDDLRDGELSDHALPNACLVASGMPVQQVERYVDLWMLQRRALFSADLPTEPEQCVPVLFERMHQQLLRHYVHDADSLQQLLDSGEYNCMSASFLFLSLCQSAGITAQAVTTRGHVRVHVDAFPHHDIETTCVAWPDALVPRHAGDKADWRPLDDAQFVAKVYFNRATRALQSAHWSRAIALANTACEIDPHDRAAAENRLAAYNEWALAAFQDHQRELALSLIDEALQSAPDDPTLRANRRYLQGR